MRKIVLLSVAILSTLSACNKKGCTGYKALNRDYKAKTDDGSCLYWGGYQSDFMPPTGKDITATDPESAAYFRLMTATSTDGIDWTATGDLISDQANVPDMIERDDSLFLYYTGWNVGAEQNKTVVAISADEGNKWVFKYISFLGYQSGELTNNGNPDVIYTDNGMIRMFITTVHNGTKSVLCYESENGFDFEFIDVATHSPTNDMFDSNTYYWNGIWHQFTINSTNNVHWYSTSTDGIHFTQIGTTVFDDGGNGHFASNGFDWGSTHRIFTSFLPDSNLYSFSTIDGTTWTKDSGSRLNFGTVSGEDSYLKDPAIIQLDWKNWLMVYVTRIP